jgi:hypothetical protein
LNVERQLGAPELSKRKLWRSGWVDPILSFGGDAALRRVIAQNTTFAPPMAEVGAAQRSPANEPQVVKHGRGQKNAWREDLNPSTP